MTTKILMFGEDARQKLLSGTSQLCRAVEKTLGPCGRNVAYERKYANPVITKDGVTVAKEVCLLDPLENMGAQMVKEAAEKTNSAAGDGTTTATVLAHYIFKEGNRHIISGANPIDLKRGIDKSVDKVVEYLQSVSKPITSEKEIEQIATISANNDYEIGKLISYAMERIGRNGIITTEEGKGMQDELVIVDGMQFDKGYCSPLFTTDKEKMQAVLHNPAVLILDQKIHSMSSIIPILDQVLRAGKQLLIIAEDFDPDTLSTLVLNKVRGTINMACVKAPGFGDRRRAMLEDMAVLLDATLITSEFGHLENITLGDLGSCKNAIITKDYTTLVDGDGSRDRIEERIKLIKSNIENATVKYEKDRLEERLAAICKGVAVIKVGASTELELKEKRDRIEDALNATRAAMQEGIIAGGGVTLYRARKVVRELKLTGDEKLGAQIIIKALEAPLRIIAENAGYESSVIIDKVKTSSKKHGFDAYRGEYVDMILCGIIDPTKVTRCALQNAASIAGMLLTTDTLIGLSPNKDVDDLRANTDRMIN